MTLTKQLLLRRRLLGAFALGALLAWAWPSSLPPMTRALLGWTIGVWCYVGLLLWHMLRTDAKHLQAHALALFDGTAAVLAMAVIGAAASLAAVAMELHLVKHAPQILDGWPYVLLAGATVLGSWLLLPLEFALAYAGLYHRSSDAAQGLEFPGKPKELDYIDFLYFSITIAATAQTSDVSVSSRPMRRLVLLQAALSFAFNTGVLALSINILASLLN